MARRRLRMNEFQGFAPRFGDNISKEFAQTAEAVDTSNNQIVPVKQDTLIDGTVSETLYSATEDLLHLWFFNSAWVVGNEKWFLEWTISSIPLLIQLTAGVPQKQIAATLVDLGQAVPGTPTSALNGAGSLTGIFFYKVIAHSFERNYLTR